MKTGVGAFTILTKRQVACMSKPRQIPVHQVFYFKKLTICSLALHLYATLKDFLFILAFLKLSVMQSPCCVSYCERFHIPQKMAVSRQTHGIITKIALSCLVLFPDIVNPA